MASRKVTNIPSYGDLVWVEDRRDKKLQPNGYVIDRDFDNNEILVQFYRGDSRYGIKGGDVDCFSFEDFEDNYYSYFGGIWLLYRTKWGHL